MGLSYLPLLYNKKWCVHILFYVHTILRIKSIKIFIQNYFFVPMLNNLSTAFVGYVPLNLMSYYHIFWNYYIASLMQILYFLCYLFVYYLLLIPSTKVSMTAVFNYKFLWFMKSATYNIWSIKVKYFVIYCNSSIIKYVWYCI